MYTSTDDTIVAISSAPGGAQRGIVRLSGPAALALADGLCRLASGCSLQDASGFTVHAGDVVFDATHRAPADFYVFRAPRSYTRQDLVEVHTLGAPPLLELLVERCSAAGARLAHPGEFTARAYLAGALSLPEAESVAALIRARSDDQLRAARRMQSTHLADEIAGWQQRLADLRALVEADIDFAEESIEFIAPTELAASLAGLRTNIAALLATIQAEQRAEVLPHVLLLGLPNAGKSTLLNRLTGIDRAISSAVAGTTRDLLSAPARFGDVEALLIDSAGWDASADEIISAGGERALAAAQTADVVCVVVDAAEPPRVDQWSMLMVSAATAPLVIANKCDLVAMRTRNIDALHVPQGAAGAVVWVSALTGEGVSDLQAAVGQRLSAGNQGGGEVNLALSARQRAALVDAARAIDRCVGTVQSVVDLRDVAELIAVDLCDAQDALAELTGAVTTEDLLGRIFASFCIGK